MKKDLFISLNYINMEYTGYSKSDIEKMLSIIHNGEHVTPD